MKLVSFIESQNERIGVLHEQSITDLSRSCPALPREMCAFLAAGDQALEMARNASGDDFSLEQVKLLCPVPRPRKILGTALNYRDHLAEVRKLRPNFKEPTGPMLFTKHSNSVTGPFDPIFLPPESEQVDYEAEMAVVIGKRCRRVPKERAFEVVAGAMAANDVSVRDWQLASPTMTLGKSWDSHCPMGPALVTTDEVDMTNVDFTCTVNGEQRQSSNTSNLIFGIPHLINHLSTVMTLEAGDVILTGTSSGVALWMPGQPWLKSGDSVVCDFGPLGRIQNSVELDPFGIMIE